MQVGGVEAELEEGEAELVAGEMFFFESGKVVFFFTNAPPIWPEQVVVEIHVFFPSVAFSDRLSLGKPWEKIFD